MQRRAPALILFGATLFVSATLLFLIQPMFARFVLPRLGGAPAVWIVAVLFFQAALLLGYVYVHGISARVSTRAQIALHAVLVLVPLLFLPFSVPDDWDPPADDDPVLPLLGLFATTVGVPYFVVATSAPLLQRWLTGTRHPDAEDPYFLYAASNVGSLIGLLGYPLLVERLLDLGDQADTWAIGYGLLMALVLGCGAWRWRAGDRPPSQAEPGAGAGGPTWRRRAGWVALAFVPVSLMLGVTTKFTTDLAPIPLLWALPLSLYLLTFVIAFSGRLDRQVATVVPWAFVVLALGLLGAGLDRDRPLWLFGTLHLAVFFLGALACHGRVAADRPAARHLTEYYVWLAVGGALGGTFNTIVAPGVFEGLTEYPLALLAAFACIRLGAARSPTASDRRLDVLLPASLLGALVLVALATEEPEARLPAVAAAVACAIFALRRRPLRLALGVAALMAGTIGATALAEDVIRRDRSFFGAREVVASTTGRFHVLRHGTTIHGAQRWDGHRPPEPLTYYWRAGPVGEIAAVVRARGLQRSAALVGLGTGSMACYARPGDRWTFYEIDPTIVEMARDPRAFTFLRDCPGEHPIMLGDARLKLAGAPGAAYGFIALDAFNSDAIPVHLMTREAIALYLRKLRPGGLLAYHVTNRYLDLEPVIGNLARAAGLACRARKRESAGGFRLRTRWVAMARSPRDLGALATRWPACRTDGGRLWTDDYSNVLGALDL